MYDPQLGRFHAIDPLADEVPGISPYQFGFNNPIAFQDPSGLTPLGSPGPGAMGGAGSLAVPAFDPFTLALQIGFQIAFNMFASHMPAQVSGGLQAANMAGQAAQMPPDDYFDYYGNYVGSDNAPTNNIRLLTSYNVTNFLNLDGTIKRYSAFNNSVGLEELEFLSPDRNEVLSRIATHYNKQLGNKGEIGAKRQHFSSMFTDGQFNINVTLGSEGKIYAKEMSNKYNMMNTLVHENIHVKLKHNVDQVDFGKGSIEHLKAYEAQITHSSWKNVDFEHKDRIINNIGKYIGSIKNDNLRYKTKLKFENILKIKFIKYGKEWKSW